MCDHVHVSSKKRRPEAGFTLIGMIGILSVAAVFAAVLVPNVMTRTAVEKQGSELENLKVIAQGAERYLQSNLAWPPSLAALSPGYVPLPSAQVTLNGRGFPRYLVIHPNVSTFDNTVGLVASELSNSRFLLISNVEQDAAPSITNATQFETWWSMDETATPGLYIWRENAAEPFRGLTLKAGISGGSYRIESVSTNSAGGTLADHARYHLKGSIVGLDGNNAFPVGNPDLQFSLNADAEYRHCSGGWQMGADSICPGGGGEEKVYGKNGKNGKYGKYGKHGKHGKHGKKDKKDSKDKKDKKDKKHK